MTSKYDGFDSVTNAGGIASFSRMLNLSSYPRTATLTNTRIALAGTALFQVQAATELRLGITLRSYSLQAAENIVDPQLVSGAYFNARFAQIWYGIGSKSLTSNSSDVTTMRGTNYYNNPASLPSAYIWTPITPALASGDPQASDIINVTTNISLTVHSGQYLVFLITGPASPIPVPVESYVYSGMVVLSGLPSNDGMCVGPESKVLMGNGEYKCIKDIQRGDVVMQDEKTKSTAVVSRVYSDAIMADIVHIPVGLLGNKEEVICTELHPIWKNDDSGRVWAKDVPGVVIKHMCGEFYNLQFDEEGTFIVDGIKIDSLSPYHKYSPLPKDAFIDQSKFIPGRKVKDENDPSRNKPLLKVKTRRAAAN